MDQLKSNRKHFQSLIDSSILSLPVDSLGKFHTANCCDFRNCALYMLLTIDGNVRETKRRCYGVVGGVTPPND